MPKDIERKVEKTKRICRTCNKEFEGERWKKQCLDCYINFKGMPRISLVRRTKGVLIQSYPGVTKEEVDEWIKKRFGSVDTPSNWGAVEVTGRKAKIWWNCQNTD